MADRGLLGVFWVLIVEKAVKASAQSYKFVSYKFETLGWRNKTVFIGSHGWKNTEKSLNFLLLVPEFAA